MRFDDLFCGDDKDLKMPKKGRIKDTVLSINVVRVVKNFVLAFNHHGHSHTATDTHGE